MRRLSEIKGEDAIDVMANIAGPVISIASDENALAFFKPEEPKDGQKPMEAFAERMKVAAPALMKTHRRELVEILSAFDGTSCEEYLDGLTMQKLFTDIFTLLTDEDFDAFLSSQQQTAE